MLPDFQRAFVWSQKQSSRLIDSFLKGLPVPPIYLFKNLDSHELLVVDGHQRVQSIANFFEGHFGSETPGERQTFALTGLEEGSQYEGLTYRDMKEQEPGVDGIDDIEEDKSLPRNGDVVPSAL